MDFSSQLASLQKAAASTDRRRGGDTHPSPSQGQAKRPRHRRRRRRYYFNEHAMQKALATLPHYRPCDLPKTTTTTTTTTTNLHIALLFITIDDLPFEHIWKEWMSDSSSSSSDEGANDGNDKVSVLCHAKFPERVKSDWLKQRLLVQPPKMGRGNTLEPVQYHSRRPEWGSIEITRAMLDLMHEGLLIGTAAASEATDPRLSSSSKERYGHSVPITHFIFVSETCLPVSTLTQVTTALRLSSGQSWVNARNTPNNGYSRQQQFEKVDPVVPTRCVHKADQWMVLTREHATAVMELDRHLPPGAYLWQCFDDTTASDELYFPTALALLGILTSPSFSHPPIIARRRVTYCDWSVSARNPASFIHGAEDLKRVAAVARNEGCLFARKFTPFQVLPGDTSTTSKPKESTGQITVEEWKECIQALAEVSTAKQPPDKE